MNIKQSIGELESSLSSMERLYKRAFESLILIKSVVHEKVEQDDLTHLLRRDSFMTNLNEMLVNARTNDKTVYVMMLDLDHFKMVNDSHGHQKGDEVLERVSQLIQNYLRPQDLAGRYGGEEVIVAVECSQDVAIEIAERIRKALEVMIFKSQKMDHSPFSITMSFGVASTKESGFDPHKLIKLADENLYEAKRRGRNQVVYNPAA